MKSVISLPVAVLCASSILCAQSKPDIPAINADGPTIVAFFPNAAKSSSEDADANEALSDFEFYAERVKEPLKQRDIQFTQEFGDSFRIRVGSHTKLFTPKPDTPGYYFIAPGRVPHVEYGVMTDADLLALADEYFGPPHSRNKSVSSGHVISLPETLVSALAAVKTKSRIPVLLPSELPQPFAKAKFAIVNKASDDGYAISLYYRLGAGDSAFAAFFSADSHANYGINDLPNVRKVKLSHGLVGYFREVSCGGSCAPANIWWEEDHIIYSLQLRLRPDLPDQKQQRTMVAVANSAILAGPR